MFCPNCGKEYYENQNFCRYCGANLTENNTEEQQENTNETTEETQYSDEHEQNEQTAQQVDLTVSTQEDDLSEEEKVVSSEETDLQCELDPQITSETVNEEEFTEKNNEESFFSDLKSSFIYEKDGVKHLTTSAITLLVVLLLFVIFMFNLLWSINDAIQINPSMTNENALMNIPNDNEDGAYTQAPEPKEEQEESITEQQEENHEFAEQKEEPPIVPIEEIRQMEQQFPEPEIPMPQEFTEDDTH